MPRGPRWGQTDKWGRPKCKVPTRANGGIKPKGKKKKPDNKDL